MRQLILDRNISLGEIIPVEGKQYHYLSRVLRLKPGTIIGVSGKDGISGQCLITEVNPVLQTLFLKCLSLKETDTALEITGKTVPINLFIWMVKSHKMEQIIRQATETGVKNIFDPPRPSAAGGAGVSAFFRLRPVPSPFAAGRGILPLPRCKMRLFLHIVPLRCINLFQTGQTIGEDPNGCAAELHMMI